MQSDPYREWLEEQIRFCLNVGFPQAERAYAHALAKYGELHPQLTEDQRQAKAWQAADEIVQMLKRDD